MKATITLTTTVTYAGTLADLQRAVDLALDCGQIQTCIREACEHTEVRIVEYDNTEGTAARVTPPWSEEPRS